MLARTSTTAAGQANWGQVLGGHVARAELYINQAALAIDAAISGQGLAMTNPAFVDDALRIGRLVQVVEDPVKTDLDYYLVISKKLREDKVIAAVSSWIKRQLA
jgi:LysR family glycine cleavage system transcriptional activator